MSHDMPHGFESDTRDEETQDRDARIWAASKWIVEASGALADAHQALAFGGIRLAEAHIDKVMGRLDRARMDLAGIRWEHDT